MKKLMVAIAAAATAFGLYAADDPGFKSGTGFDSMAAGAKTLAQLNTDDAAEGTGGTWSQADGVGAEVKAWVSSEKLGEAYRPDQYANNITQVNYLWVTNSLEKPLTRTMTGDAMSLATGDAYVDTLVKFTACDEEITTLGDAAAKIAVWVREDEEAGTTNLMITAGKILAADGSVQQQNYDCGSFDGVDAWHRLTIKAIGNIAKSDIDLVGFVVFIDGNVAGTALACDDDKGYDGYKTIMNDVATLWDKNGQLFPSLKGTTAGSISALGVAGQGGIDDISFTTTAPTWANKSAATITWDANVDYVVVTDGDNVSTNYTSPKVVESGKAYTVEAKAKSGYAIVAFDASWTPAANAMLAITTVAAAAEFDGIGYATFAEALAAANKSTKQATLKLWDDVETNESFNNEAGNWILDLNGNAIDNVEVEKGILKIIDSGNGGSVGTLATYEGVSVTIADGKYDVLDLDDGTLVIEGDDAEFFDEITGGLEIADADDLSKLALVVNAGWDTTGKTFLQTANIPDVGEFAGIGEIKKDIADTTKTFKGTFDGQGYTITGIEIPNDTTYRGALFNTMSGNAVVKNVDVMATLSADDATGDYGAAVIAGSVKGPVKFENCTARGTLTGCHNTAGIVCKLTANDGAPTLTACTNEATLVNNLKANPKVAGITALCEGATLTDCYNKGAVTLTYGEGVTNSAGGAVAGLVAYAQNAALTITGGGNEGTITKGAAKVDAETTYPVYIGSLIGRIQLSVSITGAVAQDTLPFIGSRNGTGTSSDGANFATVANGVATGIADASVEKGTSEAIPQYKVMTQWAAWTDSTFANGDAIAFEVELFPTWTATVTKEDTTPVAGKLEGNVLTYTLEEQGYPTEWPEADQGVKDKFAAWSAGVGKGADLTLPVSQAAFLLNVAPNAVKPLVIESITVDGNASTIVVSSEGANLNNVNGVLYVEAGDKLDAMVGTTVTVTPSGDKASITVAKPFVKAVIGFKGPKAD